MYPNSSSSLFLTITYLAEIKTMPYVANFLRTLGCRKWSSNVIPNLRVHDKHEPIHMSLIEFD